MKGLRLKTLFAILGLLLLAMFHGCGESPPTAPFGSVIAISPSTATISTPDGTFVQPMSARVTDFEGSPLNGVKVVVTGGFAYPYQPSSYYFFDKDGVTQRNSGFEAVTDDYGVYNFYLHIPAVVSTQLNPPTLVTAVSVSGGGNLPAAAYSYQVTALSSPATETNGSVALAITTTVTGGITVNWSAVAGAVSYRIYGRTAGTEALIAEVLAPTLSYTDYNTNNIPLATAPTPTVNTTMGAYGINTFTDKVEVRSGSNFGSADIKFN